MNSHKRQPAAPVTRRAWTGTPAHEARAISYEVYGLFEALRSMVRRWLRCVGSEWSVKPMNMGNSSSTTALWRYISYSHLGYPSWLGNLRGRFCSSKRPRHGSCYLSGVLFCYFR